MAGEEQMTDVEWVPVIQKETVEEDSLPFATATKTRTVKTTRTWYVNKNHMPLSADMIRILESVPEQ